jgi:hypothetical protein
VLADRVLGLDLEAGVLRAEGGLSLRGGESPGHAARLVPARHAGHQIRDARRHGGERRARQEPPSRRLALAGHVRALRLRLADDSISTAARASTRICSGPRSAAWVLLGHILEVEFQLERIASPWIWQESERIGNIDEYWPAFARQRASMAR